MRVFIMEQNKIAIGEPAPEFSTKAFHNDKIIDLKLSNYKGKWIVLAFYPADFTFICPTELVSLAEHYDQFKKLNTEILSVSTDTAFSHKAWWDNSPSIRKITYPMMADPTGNICRAYGTYIETEGLSLRGTFIIDPDGILKSMDVHDNSIGRNTAEIIRKLQAAQYVRQNGGEVCPANWQPGTKTLRPGLDLVGKI